MTVNPDSTYDVLDRLAMSAELWGKEFAAAGRAGAKPGTATLDEEDSDLPGTVARWMTSLSDYADPAAAADLVSHILAWLAAAHEAAQIAAQEGDGAAALSRFRADGLHVNWIVHLQGLRALADEAQGTVS